MSNVKISTQQPHAARPSPFGHLRGRLPKDTGIFIVMLGIALILNWRAGMCAINLSC